MEVLAALARWIWNAPRRYVTWCLDEMRKDDEAFEKLSDDEKNDRIAGEWP